MKDNIPQMQIDIFEALLQKGDLTEQELKIFFQRYSDVSFIATTNKNGLTAFYCEGMVDTVQLNKYYHSVSVHINGDQSLEEDEDVPPITVIQCSNEMIEKLFSGFLIYYKENIPYFYAIEISKVPQRTPEESKTEISLKGSRDGFTEELHVNISLIRKRLKTEQLFNESFELGTLSKTKVSLLYLGHKANKKTVKEVRKRLDELETESIISTGQLEQWISDRTFSLFPHFDYVTRPDFAVECLLRGRFLIIVDGLPSILIGPINLFAILKSPEDVHFPYYIVAFQRVIRIFGLSIAIFVPGFYIAITNVNIDQLPFSLLATIVVSRQGLPFALPFEAFFVLILFELLREAGIRMPTAVGQTISIVGGLIIGDAAIRAGLTSPTLLVVVAVAAVATYTLVNQSLTGTVTILRIYTMTLSTFLGVYGFILSVLIIVIYLAQLESFKIAYLEPVSSLSFKEYFQAFLINPFQRKKIRTQMLHKRRR